MNSSTDFINELKTRTQIAPNIDIDGMLSAMILTKAYPHLKIEGLTDSKTNIWLTKEATIDKMIYLDFYTKRQNVCCIDQHIIDVEDINYEDLKFNPNRQMKKTLKNYTSKFPYSTFMYILWLMEQEGVAPDIDLDREITDGITLLDLLLRGDGIYINCVTYFNNTSTWEKRIMMDMDENSILGRLFAYIHEHRTEEEAMNHKFRTENAMSRAYGSVKDGFSEPSDGFYRMLKDIYTATDTPDNYSHSMYNMNTYRFIRPQIQTDKREIMQKIIDDDRVLSYAFVKRNGLSIQIRPKDYEIMNEYNLICKGYNNIDGKFVKI